MEGLVHLALAAAPMGFGGIACSTDEEGTATRGEAPEDELDGGVSTSSGSSSTLNGDDDELTNEPSASQAVPPESRPASTEPDITAVPESAPSDPEVPAPTPTSPTPTPTVDASAPTPVNPPSPMTPFDAGLPPDDAGGSAGSEPEPEPTVDIALVGPEVLPATSDCMVLDEAYARTFEGIYEIEAFMRNTEGCTTVEPARAFADEFLVVGVDYYFGRWRVTATTCPDLEECRAELAEARNGGSVGGGVLYSATCWAADSGAYALIGGPASDPEAECGASEISNETLILNGDVIQVEARAFREYVDPVDGVCPQAPEVTSASPCAELEVLVARLLEPAPAL